MHKTLTEVDPFAFWEHHPLQFLTLFSIMVITQSDLCRKHIFYKYGLIVGPKGFPDMIFSAFDMKFHD